MMTQTHREELTQEQLDTIAWRFLRSTFTSQIYADWPLDRRVDAYLLHSGPAGLVNDGTQFDMLVERIMTNVGPALRSGVLRSPTRDRATSAVDTVGKQGEVVLLLGEEVQRQQGV